MNSNNPDRTGATEAPFRSRIGSLLFLAGIFFLNFLSRVILSPLMPSIERDLKIGHEEAGSLFFIISLGYCAMLLGSGFVSCRLNHRKTIILSSLAAGGALLLVGWAPHLWAIRIGLLLLGLAAGLYLPSGIASVIGLASPKDRGKAIGIHELAPTLGFTLSPLLAEALLAWFSWRGVLAIVGVASIAAGLIFAVYGRGGEFRGEAPHVKIVRVIVTEPSFWVMMALFTLGFGAGIGVYSMIPLYLVSERGMDRTWANTLLGLSRITTPAVALFSGWLTDRLSLGRTMKVIFLSLGIVTAMFGLVPTPWIMWIVFIQSMISAAFFPAGFAALSRIGSKSISNVAVSFTIPVSFLLGGGAVPAGIGIMGDAGFFAAGFVILGGLIFCGIIVVRYLKLRGDERECDGRDE
jgi:NNP family nitrate/nitrite transporter-like MFS transporter